MVLFGVISLIAGVLSAGFGIYQNNDPAAQLNSFLSSGSVNPGNLYLYIGIALAVVGVVLLIVGKKKS